MVIKVAVIGAGAAGLAALRHMKSRLDEFEPVAFEQMPVVGGTWVYSDDLVDKHGRPLPSSMYKHLRTNLPKEAMAFPDYPFPDHLPSFIGHEDVLQYLKDYARHFDLFSFIRFETEVERVHPVHKDSGPTTWLVRVRDLTKETDNVTEMFFDAVIVCNGHYTVPLIPEISGKEEFSGNIFHSHEYRTPDMLEGKRVIVLGARASGIDLAIEIASVAEKVWLCHRNSTLQTPLPENVTEARNICRLTRDSAILDDGQVIAKIDALALCTGYRYSFPFLSSECQCSVTDYERVMPLYKHLIHTRHTSLFFIGITKFICPFPAFYCQIQFSLAVLSGKVQLPSEKDMEEDIRRDFEWRLSRGMKPSAAHTMGDLQWAYNAELAHLAGVEPVPLFVEKLCKHCADLRQQNALIYRENNFRVCNKEEFFSM